MSLDHCAEILRANSCIAFIGAGVSTTYINSNNIEYEGYPTAQEFVKVLSRRDPSNSIKPDMSFEKACFLYILKYKRHGFNEILSETYDKGINPLPAHHLLAELPFSAYISMNYDIAIELALKGNHKNFLRITSDKDVTRINFSDVPLIYPHGCIADLDSCLTAQDEIYPFFKNKQLIRSLIKILLASKSIIFFGFSLNDNDFHELYRELREILGDNMPLSYAICKNCEEYNEKYWDKQGIKIINQDLTTFLSDLFYKYYGSNYEESKNAWILNEFFISLHKIHNIPSESQAIDSFINHLYEELKNITTADKIKSLAERAKKAKDYLIEYRPNFEAFKKCSNEALSALEKNKEIK